MIQKPRGTKDIYGKDQKIYKFIFDNFRSIAKSYNLEEITTPIFESYELFKDTNGESSDIVTKEIYKFQDLGGRILALRPEGTASVGRAIIENKMYLDKKYNKLYYIGSMFRYEKPQKGRLRQFYQIGIELTNELNEYTILESIMIGHQFLTKLGIEDYKLYVNNLGTEKDRKKYINDLKKYFLKHKTELSIDSQNRIEINPLRILDDKNDSNLDIVKNAPKINEFLSDDSKEEFRKVLNLLDQLKIPYEIDSSLVRGLDYYSNFVFEFVSFSKHLGTKSTLIGGGCYLDLVDSKSNPINGVGFGCGVERLFEIIKGKNQDDFKSEIDVYFILESSSQFKLLIPLIYKLRYKGISVEYNYSLGKKFKKLLNNARLFNPKLIVFQELNQQNSNIWTVKLNGSNKKIDEKKMFDEIISNINKYEKE